MKSFVGLSRNDERLIRRISQVREARKRDEKNDSPNSSETRAPSTTSLGSEASSSTSDSKVAAVISHLKKLQVQMPVHEETGEQTMKECQDKPHINKSLLPSFVSSYGQRTF